MLDRLIVERIKWFMFIKAGDTEKTRAQEELIQGIRELIITGFVGMYKDKTYEYSPENRTFQINEFLRAAEDLVINNINIGDADRERLSEIQAGTPDVYKLIYNEILLRVNNERRSKNKNIIDDTLKNFIHE